MILSKQRRTKIIATLGPSLDDPSMMEKILQAGVDMVRANFSHGTASDHAKRIQSARNCAEKLGHEIGVLADLQGPKIRIARFQQGHIFLEVGAEFILDANLPSDKGNEKHVGIDYKELPNDVHQGDRLLLDDGRLILIVKEVQGSCIHCIVEVGGKLSNNKGINRQGGGLSAAALTEKDKEDMKTAVALGIDYIAISFPRSAADIHEARHLLEELGSTARIIAKIERAEAIKAIDEIIEAADAVMVARGDLGVEIGDAELPAVQKHIIHQARTLNKAVITATQMMESMIHNTIPTRAEVFDVANAVLDGTDAVMLSAETATGLYPDKVIEAVSRICLSAEKHPSSYTSRHRVECYFQRVDEAIAMATMYTANHMNIKAIIALTESGVTPLWMSRIRSGIPIYGLSRHIPTLRLMSLYRGVFPVYFDFENLQDTEIEQNAIATLLKQCIVRQGDWIIITRGKHMGVHGGTNAMKIIQVPHSID
ncbi:MAG: Pyruvate kinase II [Legionellaceae bacterium]